MRRAEVVVVLALGTACKHAPPPTPVPSVTHPIAIDGEWNEPDWSGRALRGVFLGDDGKLARPSSEIRILHDDRELIVALYAADEDIETRDRFELRVGAFEATIDSTGKLVPPIPRVRAVVDFDEGTRDDPRDEDEEWVVELAIPLDLVDPVDRVAPVRAARCDTPKDGVTRCGAWSATLAID